MGGHLNVHVHVHVCTCSSIHVHVHEHVQERVLVIHCLEPADSMSLQLQDYELLTLDHVLPIHII